MCSTQKSYEYNKQVILIPLILHTPICWKCLSVLPSKYISKIWPPLSPPSITISTSWVNVTSCLDLCSGFLTSLFLDSILKSSQKEPVLLEHGIPLFRMLQWLPIAPGLKEACKITPPPPFHFLLRPPSPAPSSPATLSTCHSSNTLDMAHSLCSSNSLYQKGFCPSFTLLVSLYSNITLLVSPTLTTIRNPTTYSHSSWSSDNLLIFFVYCLLSLLPSRMQAPRGEESLSALLTISYYVLVQCRHLINTC